MAAQVLSIPPAALAVQDAVQVPLGPRRAAYTTTEGRPARLPAALKDRIVGCWPWRAYRMCGLHARSPASSHGPDHFVTGSGRHGIRRGVSR